MTYQQATTFPIAAPAYAKQKRSAGKILLVIVLILVMFLIVSALGLFALFKFRDEHRLFYIPSGAMTPTLQVGSRVRTDKLSASEGINRGWIVICDAPPGTNPDLKKVIKRVVALPGETVEARNGKVFVNDKQLDEPYLDPSTLTLDLPRTVVPADSYFLLGDNRTDSADSRVYGPLKRSDITHHAVQIISPKIKSLP